MHLQVLPPKDRDLRGFLHCPVQKKQMGITKCCTFTVLCKRNKWSCAKETNGYYKMLHFLSFWCKVRKSTYCTCFSHTCLGTGKSVGVLCKTTQKRTQWNYNELH